MATELQARHLDAGSASFDGLDFGVDRLRFEASTAWLVGGLLLLLVVPFTLVVILPTNKRLESQELDLRSEEAGHLLRRWGRLHAIRSILSGAAFLVFLSALATRR